MICKGGEGMQVFGRGIHYQRIEKISEIILL